ncbi:hypothetical protein [Escherichia coli]|uniref:hypothetical protein n=1 Tax=Escherichia coli TaxID=562 RepID=UPI0032E38F33
MASQKSHHLPFDYSLFPPVLTLITAALIIVSSVVLLPVPFPGVPLVRIFMKGDHSITSIEIG